ncbi:hypothetical protein HK100_002676, partial [Physocladia obscura]
MTSKKHAVIYGGNGGLGVRIVAAFQEAGWQTTSVDFRANPSADNSIALLPDLSFEATAVHVAAELDRISSGAKVDAIVNVAGGWAGGNLLDDDLLKNVSLMISQSVNSSVITAKLSATHLKDDGLLLLVGADAAKEGTPGMIAYGIAKAGVHQLVKSIAASGSGFPAAATVVAILPVTLDTPMNRKFMPDADTSAWTPLQHLAEKILRWADKTEKIASGSLLRVLTKDGKTEFVGSKITTIKLRMDNEGSRRITSKSSTLTLRGSNSNKSRKAAPTITTSDRAAFAFETPMATTTSRRSTTAGSSASLALSLSSATTASSGFYDATATPTGFNYISVAPTRRHSSSSSSIFQQQQQQRGNIQRRVSVTSLLGFFSPSLQHLNNNNTPWLATMTATKPGVSLQSSRLQAEMLSLLGNVASADVEIVVSSDRLVFTAHRLILSTRSKFFKTELKNFPLGQLAVLALPNVDPDAFRILLRYIYTAEEDDAASYPFTRDWRLVLACHQVAIYLHLFDRAAVYQRTFALIFSALVSSNTAVKDSETVQDMWCAIAAPECAAGDDLLVACAPAFWIAYGRFSGSSSSSDARIFDGGYNGNRRVHGLSVVGRRLLVGLRIPTLVKVVNAIPDTLETAVGKFRIVEGWIMAQPDSGIEYSSEDDDYSADNGSDAKFEYSRDRIWSSVLEEDEEDFKDYESDFGTEDNDEKQDFIEQRGYESSVVGSLSPDEPRQISTDSSKSPAGTLYSPEQNPRRLARLVHQKLKQRQSYHNLKSQVSSHSIKSAFTTITTASNGIAKNTPATTNNPVATESSINLEARALKYQKSLQKLELYGLTAPEILNEIEPARVLSDSQILGLYRAAAAAAAASPQGASMTWMPVPSGFRGRRCSTWNSRTRWTSVGGAAVAVGAAVAADEEEDYGGFVTYCTPEALGRVYSRTGGKYTWTVVPLQNVNGIGIGVSADIAASGGGKSKRGSGSGVGEINGVADDLFEKIGSGMNNFFGGGSGSGRRRRESSATLHGSDSGNSFGGGKGGGGGVSMMKAGKQMKFVGDDGGWSLWADGSLRVGKIFVGRLPKGVTFSRGTAVTVKLDFDTRTLGFEVGGFDCGIAFRNLPPTLHPSVVLVDDAAVSISPVKR